MMSEIMGKVNVSSSFSYNGALEQSYVPLKPNN